MNEKIEKTIDFVKEYFKDDASGHDWWHTYRVWITAKEICLKEKGDLFIVEMAALLHDVDDFKFSDGKTLKAPQWLKHIKVDGEISQKILDAINSVSFKGLGVDTRPNSLEGKIVQDADRLDSLGAIAIARTFAYGGFKNRQIFDPNDKPKFHHDFESYKSNKGSSINHFYEKLLHLKDLINTQTARKIANQRHQFLEKFLEEFYIEWDSKDILK